MLAAEELDVVSVATPNCYHAVHACAALKAGADVLLERPAAVSLREVDRIARAVRASKRRLIIGLTHRFMRGNQRAKKALTSGVIGRPYMIRVRLVDTGPSPGWAKSKWPYDPKLAGGGVMLNTGVQAIDLATWLVGPVRSVQAQCKTLRKGIKVDDNAAMMLEFADGRAMGYVEVGWASPSGFSGWEICGDEGSMVCDNAGALVVHRGKLDPSGKRRGVGTKVLDPKPQTGGWNAEISDCLRAFARKDVVELGIEAGRRTLALALAAYESSRIGRRLSIGR
jgi:predicted dehydrogenase